MASHEPHTFDAPRVLRIGFALGVILAVLLGAVRLASGPPRSAQRNAALGALPPEPRLQPTPRADFECYRREKQADLERYAWVDRANGVVQIPIERAMELRAARQDAAK